MMPRVMGCSKCDLKIEAHFEENEFANLCEDDLHFLRIFIHCEGRIRDMEKSLGISYPTVKAKLSTFKKQLQLTPQSTNEQPKESDLLDKLNNGEMSYEEVMSNILGKKL